MQYFEPKEFACPCCGGLPTEGFMNLIDKTRAMAQTPFVITSGFRCQKHNERVGGVKDSAHTKGVAVDIKVGASQARYRVIRGAIAAGFTRIGIAKTFIHIDCDLTLPQGVIWTYDV
jgi:uncharacterized protein YcbK (DUF882 family)